MYVDFKHTNSVYFLIQCCSDNEDLFEGYDSIVGDSSFLAKLEDVELQMRQCQDQQTPNACEDDLSDSILAEDFRDSPPRALPRSQLEFQKAVTSPHKSPSRGAHNTSTPDLMNPRPAVNHADLTANKPPPKARRSMKDHLKKILIDNAATSCTVSKTVQQKEAVMTEEMSFAMQAMGSISAEQDLGPFFGLPSKVKDLILKLKRIQDLYGKYFTSYPIQFCPYWHLVNQCFNPFVFFCCCCFSILF